MSVRAARRTCLRCGTALSRYNPDDVCSPCAGVGAKQSVMDARPEQRDAWLWRAAEQDTPEGLKVGQILAEWRELRHVSQADLGRRLGWTQQYISALEGGRQLDAVSQLRHISRVLEIPLREFGLVPEVASDTMNAGEWKGERAEREVSSSQRVWRMTRRHLNRHRAELAKAAAQLYEPELRIEPTTLISGPGWLPADPVDLADVRLKWVDAADPAVDGGVAQAQALCPLRAPDQPYDRYTAAIRYLDPPALFENRPSYRLLGLSWSDQRSAGWLRFGLSTYFDKLDLAEALGHELAAAWPRTSPTNASSRLPLRSLIGDPFDLDRRAVIPAITTLTLRRTGATASFLLHWRDPDRVATAGGTYDVIPAGEFQPSSMAPGDQRNDFDLWRNMAREFSEELLGEPEYDGSRGRPVDYAAWPLFRDLSRARAEGRLSAHCLGVGLDALTLAATILTVVLIDDDLFDDLFAAAVRVNAEGVVVSLGRDHAAAEGIPFTDENVTRLVGSEPMASPGAACLTLAWRHRAALLSG
jgi:transcriptional regulator with XRE-family HTH domain